MGSLRNSLSVCILPPETIECTQLRSNGLYIIKYKELDLCSVYVLPINMLGEH